MIRSRGLCPHERINAFSQKWVSFLLSHSYKSEFKPLRALSWHTHLPFCLPPYDNTAQRPEPCSWSSQPPEPQTKSTSTVYTQSVLFCYSSRKQTKTGTLFYLLLNVFFENSIKLSSHIKCKTKSWYTGQIKFKGKLSRQLNYILF